MRIFLNNSSRVSFNHNLPLPSFHLIMLEVCKDDRCKNATDRAVEQAINMGCQVRSNNGVENGFENSIVNLNV